MASSEIGLGLIGAGRHGIRYARHVIQDIANARLRAVCRQHPDRELDIPGSEGVELYGRPEQLIADPRVDAIILVVPPVLHKDLCLQLSRRGSRCSSKSPCRRITVTRARWSTRRRGLECR